MSLKFCVVGEHPGVCVSLDERVVKIIELNVCKRWWCKACDPQSTDTGDGGFPHRCVGVFDRANAKLQRSGMNIVC